MDSLRDKVAVVTGAAGGIGLALASLLAAEGARVALADVHEEALTAAVDALVADGAKAIAVPTDVTDAKAVDLLAERAQSELGGCHVACLNAGVPGTFGRTWTTSIDEWRWVLEVNLWGPIHGIRTFVPGFVAQGEGHVMITGSAAGFEALPGMGPYGASKHAVVGMAEALHRELASIGSPVGVTVLIPGGIVRSAIMDVEASWPARLGDLPPADPDPVAAMIKTSFTAGVAQGNDPALCAAAGVQAIKDGRFLACDEPGQLADWGRHHADLAAGSSPAWPPA